MSGSSGRFSDPARSFGNIARFRGRIERIGLAFGAAGVSGAVVGEPKTGLVLSLQTAGLA